MHLHGKPKSKGDPGSKPLHSKRSCRGSIAFQYGLTRRIDRRVTGMCATGLGGLQRRVLCLIYSD